MIIYGYLLSLRIIYQARCALEIAVDSINNSANSLKLVEEAGFEPANSYEGRFTVKILIIDSNK